MHYRNKSDVVNNWKEGVDFKLIEYDSNSSLMFISGNNFLFKVSNKIAGRLYGGISNLNKAEKFEFFKIFECGILDDINGKAIEDSSPLDGANLAINFNITVKCNLDCIYCFANGGSYGHLKRDLKADSVKQIFSFIQENVGSSKVVRLEFFGGEPLLNYKLIKEICTESDRVHRKTGIRFIYRLSTNLTHITKAMIDLFTSYNFIISVSIDGGRLTHNHNRPSTNGDDLYDLLIKNCILLKKNSEDILLVARMTVFDDKVPLEQNVKELLSYNIFDYFQIFPVTTDKISSNKDHENLSVKNKPGLEMLRLIEAYPSLFSSNNIFKGNLEWERIADIILNGKAALSYCSAGRNYYTFSSDCSIMPCHRLVGNDKYQIGDLENFITTDHVEWRNSTDNISVCSKCWIRYICAGGCKHHNLSFSGDINIPDINQCKVERRIVEHIIRIIANQKEYRQFNRNILDKLFVSCGRPIIDVLHPSIKSLSFKTKYFLPVM